MLKRFGKNGRGWAMRIMRISGQLYSKVFDARLEVSLMRNSRNPIVKLSYMEIRMRKYCVI